MHLFLKGSTTNTILCAKRFCFAQKKRSFYQILDIQTNFSQRQLRKKYLIKARKFHPDHNQEPGAVEEFKLIKQAYETLQNPQKKLMYDSGVSQTPEDVTPVHDNQVRQGKKYYQNKWYGYNRPGKGDVRDEYYEAKQEYFAQKPTFPVRAVLSFTVVVLSVFVYDVLWRIQTKKEKEMNESIKVLQNSSKGEENLSRRQKVYRGYMEKREKLHKVDV